MWRLVFIAFLIAHGGVHAAIWAAPKPKDQDAPFDPSHSWLLGSQKALAVSLAVGAAVLLVAAGVGLWTHAEWWRAVAIVGLSASLGLMAVHDDLVVHRQSGIQLLRIIEM